MAWLAGIDEVGYGPKLGPLVVTATLFEVPDASIDLWKALKPAVSREGREGAVTVCDSKRLYHPPDVAPLERTALAFVGAPTVREFVARHCDGAERLSEAPWWGGEDVALPMANVPEEISALSEGVRSAMSRAGVRLAGVKSALADAAAFNDGVGRLENKSNFLFEISGGLYRWIWEKTGGEATVLVGKQGGRTFYSPQLQALFPETFVLTSQETQALSVYSIEARGRRMRMSYLVDAEDQSLPIALASIVAKYTREVLMSLFNRWWCAKQPGLRPTAGYAADAGRFLRETESLRRELGIDDRRLVRER